VSKTALNSVLLFLIVVALLCLSTGNQSAFAEDKASQTHQHLHQIDYKPLHFGMLPGSGQPLIQVKINDTQTATFLVDTGSSGSLISRELAEQMNLPLMPAVDSENGSPILWKGKQAMMTNISTLKAGTLLFNNAPLFVLEAKQFVLSPSIGEANPYQGILGINLLEHVAILLDGRTHKLGFCIPGNLSQEQVGQIGIAQPCILPLTHVNELQWYVTARFVNNGVEGDENLALDTGSDSTYVSEQLAKKIKLKMRDQQGNKIIYGADVVADAKTDKLSLGDLTLRDFLIAIRPASEKLPPSLGMDVLSGYRVLIDFPGGKMYIQPNPAAVPAITIGPAPTTNTPPAK